MPLLELTHVEPDHEIFATEHRLGECAGELGLADAGRAEEEEAADRPTRIAESRARAPDRVGDRRYRLFLSDDAVVELLLQLQEALSLLGGELGDRDAGRA